MKNISAITKDEFRKLSEYIKANYGIYLREEKQTLVTGRLQSVLAAHEFNSFSEYYDYLIADKTGAAAVELMNKITTNHTYFMREAEHFRYFKDTVLPKLKGSVRGKDLRIWSAGCSSGEEPYTLAMIIDEFFGEEKAGWDTTLLATDLSGKALESAQRGVYSNRSIEPLPRTWQTRYFCRADRENSVVTDKIKKEVIFRRFNLTTPTFSFRKKFHVIFCRNVMIYFGEDTKRELVRKLYDMTEDGGYLFIGHAESLNRDATRYKFVMPAVYRKKE